MKLSFLALAFAAPLAAGLAASTDAQACGGCVVAPSPQVNTIVTAHRMALSVSPKQTVLWDQIRYDGDPDSWGWLLPVKPGAVIELSTDAWFETLDAATTATVYAPPISCNSGGNNFNCGCGSADSAGAENFEGGNGVTVVHRGTVGPFETVTLSTQTPGVLDDWLTNAGFAVPAESGPVIDAYVAEGFDFIALKLQPDKSVDEMKPVRVVSPGASPTLPLRMVAIGTGATVGVTLFVISEGRFAAKNFGNTEVPIDLLSWDFAAASSNYGTLRQKVLAENAGATWLTSFAKPNALLSQIDGAVNGPRFFDVNNDFNFVNTIAEAYVKRGVSNGETDDQACVVSFQSLAQSGALVSDPCPPGKPSTDPSCGNVAAGEIDARVFECGAADTFPDSTLDDIAVAMTGLHPKDVWLTRLEADLPRAALAKDLVIEAAPQQVEIDNEMQARSGTNVDAVCPSGVIVPPGAPRFGGHGRETLVVFATMLSALITALARRGLRGARWQNAPARS